MIEKINWKELAIQVNSLSKRGEFVSGDMAKQAIELLIGENNIRDAVDYYIEGKPGSELARAVLWRIHSPAAMNRCYEIYKSPADIETRRLAIELLRVAADRQVLNWINEFLKDEDTGIQAWGIGVLDQLVTSNLIDDEDAEPLLLIAEAHHNFHVREKAAEIRALLNRIY